MSSSAAAASVGPAGCSPGAGLRERNFRRICENGFGDGLNAYPHSMLWFNERLYVGTTRANLQLLSFTIGERLKNFARWPVERPDNPYDLDLRAQVWRYDPRTGAWENVFISPLIMGSEGFEVPLAIGFRGMTAHRGPVDPAPAIYLPTWSPRLGPGPVLLRSYDGRHFEQISRPGLGDTTVTTIRSIISFDSKLFIAPTGTTKDHYSANIPDRLVIMVSENPEADDWQLACPPFFGDETNGGVFCMEVFNGFLYAGTANSEEGFQIWKTRAQGRPPYRWTKVMGQGGYRGKENQGAVAMAVFRDHLYVGTGIIGGYDRPRNIGPASPELFRIARDDSWELVVGENRVTPEGLKVPCSGLGAGFNSPTVGYFWRLCVHDGWLYLGTYEMMNWLPFFNPDSIPRRLARLLEVYGLEALVRDWGGFDLWRSRDGSSWQPVSRNGFGNPCNFGVRTMASTPAGLFIGAANPFGPRQAVRRLGGWRYEDNPRGGLEIWLGAKERRPAQARPAPEPVLPPMEGRRWRRPAWSELPAEERLTIREQQLRELYGGTDFRQCGFWNQQTRSPEEACRNLLVEMLSLLPAGLERVVELGCGETTRVIADHFPAASITALAPDRATAKAWQTKLPTVRCLRIKRAGIPLAREEADCFISVEGLRNQAISQRLLTSIYRVLRPGGIALLAEPLASAGETDSPASLRQRLQKCGFVSVTMLDTSRQCLEGFRKNAQGRLQVDLLAKSMDLDMFHDMVANLPGQGSRADTYFIVLARKPGERSAPSTSTEEKT